MATFDLGRVTPLYKGDYSASASYELNDVVLYNGNLYWHVQATATVGILPTDTTVWKLAFSDEGVRAEIRGYADDAQVSKTAAAQSASQASASASNASASASQAASSAQTAGTKASEASTSAQTASTKASEATVSAQSAASSAQTATDSATLASQKAAAASESASLATAKANAAATSETNAAASAQTATDKASEAAASATSAQEYDESAQQSAVNAQTAQGLAETAQTAAETAQGLAEDARDLAQQYAESIDPENIYSAYPTDTASGAVVSFADGADDIPLKSLVVNIDPVQDLHGYENPWPAGGGVNKLNPAEMRLNTAFGLATTIDGEEFVFSGTYTGTVEAPQFRFASYTDGREIPYNVKGFAMDSATSAHYSGFIGKTDENATLTIVFKNCVQGETYNFRVRIVAYEGDTAPTEWTPYSNICPISGWTGMTVSRTGINQWDEEWEEGAISGGQPSSGYTNCIRSKNFCECFPNTKYYLKCGDYTNNYYAALHWYDADKKFISVAYTAAGETTSPANARYFKVSTNTSMYLYGNTYNHDISINYPSTDHSYHPYTGRSITINLGQTVYGGHLDVLSGVLTVDRAMVTLDGSSDEFFNVTPLSSFTQVGWSGYISIGKPLGSFVSDTFVFKKNGNNHVSGLGYIWGTSASRCFMGFPTDVTDVATARQWLSEHPTTIIYELATPQTYQLTPHDVKSLYGQNNIFADTGDTEVEYRADTKLYIERLTEPDADMIADANIVSGQYFMVGNSLYLATANIASGSAVIVGTNCTQKSLATALNEINQ